MFARADNCKHLRDVVVITVNLKVSNDSQNGGWKGGKLECNSGEIFRGETQLRKGIRGGTV